jgi:hypothetical protein
VNLIPKVENLSSRRLGHNRFSSKGQSTMLREGATPLATMLCQRSFPRVEERFHCAKFT